MKSESLNILKEIKYLVKIVLVWKKKQLNSWKKIINSIFVKLNYELQKIFKNWLR
jgi:hypothetical protein